MNDIDRQAAREALVAASSAYNASAPGFSAVWVGFVIFCVASSFLPIVEVAVSSAAVSELFTLAPILWIAVGLYFVIFGMVSMKKGGGPRGLQKRWAIMMGVWGMWYAASISITHFADIGSNTTMWLTVNLLAWVLIAIAGVTWEMVALRKQERRVND